MNFRSLVAAASVVALLLVSPLQAENFELRPGDHICIIGNTLAERMQHDGWLETLLHHRHPQHELTIRNLGYSADELTVRLRSKDFGSPDQWLAGEAPIPQPSKLNPDAPVRQNRFELTGTKADVIFAFFGYNESFAGEAGVPKFKADLEAFIKHTLAQQYNGKSAPRLVLFSPIAYEDIGDRNLPEGDKLNEQLQLYTRAMAEVAAAQKVPFVDLYQPSLKLYEQQEPLTINGIHLNELGNRHIASVIDAALFGRRQVDPAELEDLRTAVRDKNWHWFHRYRVTDGYSTYGDRAFLRFTDGQTNYEVGQRELEMLDVLTANRDQAIWAAAQGKKHTIDDSNVPPHIPVVTNKPGPLPGGKHIFFSGEEAIEKMTIAKGMKVNLFASEKEFPELINPVQMAFDTKGRLWVAAWPTYPHWKPTAERMNDKLLILEDTDGDGKADKCKTFAGDLHNPTGFEFWNGGVLVAMAPDILFLKDVDGDDQYDEVTRVLHGLDTADTHHTANSFILDPGGALYFQEGTFHQTQVETPWGAARRVANGAVFRYEPRSQKFDVHVSHGFANPHGHAFDKWGQDIVVDGTGAQPYHGTLFSGHIEYPAKHARPPQVYQQRTRPCPGLEIVSSSHFPEEMRGNLLVPNVIGFQGILQYKLEDKDSSLGAVEVEPIVSSTDPNFRPADVETAPDGSIYFTDWHNPIIGHMQHNLRDPSRNKIYGRVYRVTYEGRPLVKPPQIAGESIENLLKLLTHSDDRIRYRTRIELSGRKSEDVLAAVDPWLSSLDRNDADYEHHLLEGLWLHQHHNVVNQALLERVLASPDYRARAAGVRVLCYWRDRVSNGLDLLRKAAADPEGRVRLEAVRAASFYTVPEAVEAPLIVAEKPLDPYIEYVHKETMRTLEPIVKRATAAGERIAFTTEVGARYFLRELSTEQLLAEPRSKAVYLEMLYRPGLRDEQRQEAVRELAKLDNRTELDVVIGAIRSLDEKESAADPSVVFDLVRQLTGRSAAELASARAELEKLATSARQPMFRQIGFVSLISVDGSVDRAWELATSNAKSLQDFVSAMPLISDPSVRATLYDKIEPLLDGLPANLAVGSGKGTFGRYVRVELPRSGTLTLAEVEVFSGSDNVARRGKATQSGVGYGGDASRAIDGNKSPRFGDGGQTHTPENVKNPWWEVDLGEEHPIDRISVFGRLEGFESRLNGYTLTVLDENRNAVFRRENNPAPKPQADFQLEGGGPESLVRRAAMLALTQVRGQEAKTFTRLSRFVRDDVDRTHAIRALQRIPRSAWPKEEASSLVTVLTAHVQEIPQADRTSQAALDALEFADALTTLLPADQGAKARAALRELGVRVIRVGTVFERMTFDKDVLVVQAGKPVEFVLDNSDLMPHNFVIVQPGSLEEIGQLAETSAQQPDAAQRHYVPASGKVLLASKLLQPRDTQKVSFLAPTAPGVYPYVCTYPGHWRRMYGALYVVENLDAYLENPEAYLSAHPLEIKDELLKDRRPRTEWKLDDLASLVDELKAGRSYGNGKQIFQVANCAGCHKYDGVGSEIGPDLTKLEAKWTSLDILKEVLDPSAKINEKYQSYTFLLDDGRVVTGLIVEETPKVVKVVENPLAKAAPLELAVDSIEERKKSPVSLMPKGLLDKLTRDEILDLIAYVSARGNRESPLFQGAGHHDHGATSGGAGAAGHEH